MIIKFLIIIVIDVQISSLQSSMNKWIGDIDLLY